LLGSKSDLWLNELGIYTLDDLRKAGAITTYIKLKQRHAKISLNLLYAMVAALEGRDWRDVAANDKGKLLMTLEAHQDFELLLYEEE